LFRIGQHHHSKQLSTGYPQPVDDTLADFLSFVKLRND